MKPLTITRCAVANEILRRRKQMESDNTHRPQLHHEQRADLISISFEDIPAATTRREQREKPRAAFTEESDSSTADEEETVDLTRIHTSAPKRTDAPSGKELYWAKVRWVPNDLEANCEPKAQHRGSSTRGTELHARQWNSAIFTAVQRKVEARTRKALSVQSRWNVSPNDARQNRGPDARNGRRKPTVIPRRRPHQADEENTLNVAYCFPPDQSTIRNQKQYVARPESHLPHSCPDVSRDTTSPASDTTLYEAPLIYSLSQLKAGEDHQPYESFEETEKHIKLDQNLSTPVPRRHGRRQRRLSIESAFESPRTPRIPLRARAKTNDGMLQFMANASKEPTKSVPTRRHRHKISLNIPVVASVPPPEIFQNPDSSPTRIESPRRMRTRDVQAPSFLTLAERELEYKHRRTFVGTASLDDLLEILEVTLEHTTTKDAVAKAFIIMSSREQLYARQCSKKADGWELVLRVTPDVTNIDFVAQLQVKLGSITLRQFLDLIPFNEEEEVEALRVVEAFSAASHIDTNAGAGIGSKARAFRSWMVSQNDIGC
ncbi:hypothetical protein N0V83_003522 [Neocucurbitaria cava]|uniref:Uncharacterized protein n=1 Tax=Neocucurbitaria cava TaxID=798079 RepID=A0A9W9CNK3_9PLEO|nr:hypothetical protein N0V83_003522 [Neocucurbitaria cava]